MGKENNGLLGKVILAAVLMIFGAVIVGVIADESYSKTIKSISTETLSLAGARLAGGQINSTYAFYPAHLTEAISGWRTETSGCSLSDLTFTLTNATGDTLVDTTDYVIGINNITFVNTDAVNNTASNDTSLSMNYCGDEYVNGWGATILNMVGGFLALLLFGAAVGVMYSIYKEVYE